MGAGGLGPRRGTATSWLEILSNAAAVPQTVDDGVSRRRVRARPNSDGFAFAEKWKEVHATGRRPSDPWHPMRLMLKAEDGPLLQAILQTLRDQMFFVVVILHKKGV